MIKYQLCRGDGIGRRSGLKIRREQSHGSSTLPRGTTLEKSMPRPAFGGSRRPNRMDFSGQKEIPDSVKYGSSRCFSEMLAIRKDYLSELDLRLDSRILRTHEPVRAKTILLSQSQ